MPSTRIPGNMQPRAGGVRDQYRAIRQLLVIEALSADTIAQRLGFPRTTVERRLGELREEGCLIAEQVEGERLYTLRPGVAP